LYFLQSCQGGTSDHDGFMIFLSRQGGIDPEGAPDYDCFVIFLSRQGGTSDQIATAI